MKKLFLTLFLIFTSVLLFAYSKPVKDKVISVSGLINVYGNEPFTFIGIKTSSGEEYSLSASEEVLNQLRKSQGKRIEITGSVKQADKNQEKPVVEFNSLKNGTLTVLNWQYADKSTVEPSENQPQAIPDGRF